MTRPLASAALLAALLLAGCSSPGGPSGPQWTEVVVPGNHMLDLQYDLPSGASLPWRWETVGGASAGPPIAFQALYVTERGTAYPLASEYGPAGQGERTTPTQGRYDLTWDNRGATDITVRFVVADGYAQRLWLPGEGGPGCPVLLQC